jgi:hypothetical protein
MTWIAAKAETTTNAMQHTCEFVAALGLPPGDAFDLPESLRRFPDGAHYRVESPSVEDHSP